MRFRSREGGEGLVAMGLPTSSDQSHDEMENRDGTSVYGKTTCAYPHVGINEVAEEAIL
jgi:hypothetical protein